jgi:hypothetical protein
MVHQLSQLPQRLVYNAAAVRRIFNLAASAVVEVRIYHNAAWVHIKGQRPRFVSHKVFINHFHEFRKQSGKNLGAEYLGTHPRYGDRWVVNSYTIELNGHVACTCEDQHQHEQACKHVWAVFHQVGASNLAEYHLRQQLSQRAQQIANAPLAARGRGETIRGISID